MCLHYEWKMTMYSLLAWNDIVPTLRARNDIKVPIWVKNDIVLTIWAEMTVPHCHSRRTMIIWICNTIQGGTMQFIEHKKIQSVLWSEKCMSTNPLSVWWWNKNISKRFGEAGIMIKAKESRRDESRQGWEQIVQGMIKIKWCDDLMRRDNWSIRRHFWCDFMRRQVVQQGDDAMLGGDGMSWYKRWRVSRGDLLSLISGTAVRPRETIHCLLRLCWTFLAVHFGARWPEASSVSSSLSSVSSESSWSPFPSLSLSSCKCGVLWSSRESSLLSSSWSSSCSGACAGSGGPSFSWWLPLASNSACLSQHKWRCSKMADMSLDSIALRKFSFSAVALKICLYISPISLDRDKIVECTGSTSLGWKLPRGLRDLLWRVLRWPRKNLLCRIGHFQASSGLHCTGTNGSRKEWSSWLIKKKRHSLAVQHIQLNVGWHSWDHGFLPGLLSYRGHQFLSMLMMAM